jgi:hypothetical protein
LCLAAYIPRTPDTMDFILDRDNPFNAEIRSSEDGPILYTISTPENLLGLRNTTFFKREGTFDHEFGVVERRKLHSDVIRVRGQEVGFKAEQKHG